jgi:tRNA A-37 threonylcarbamoyl transferase component Bud32
MLLGVLLNVSSSLPSSSSGLVVLILAAALGGGLGGGLGFLLLLCACCCVLAILCCCCALCLIVILAIVAVALVAIVAVAIGLFAAGDAGVVFFLVRGKKGKKEEDVEMDEMDVAALLADAERTSEYRVIPWSEIHTVKKLGAGAFGEVMLAEWNGVEVAVKMFRNPSKEAIDDYKHEALMMAKVSHHPNVVNFIGASFPPDGMAMVLGLCAGGSLLSALEKKKLDAAKKTRILGEVASALSFLHSLGIVHRDIAARNVLLDGHGVAKLADLGLSRLLEDKQGEQTTVQYNVGPVRWMAPEAIRDRKYSSASDAFSFGVLMAEVWSDGSCSPPTQHDARRWRTFAARFNPMTMTTAAATRRITTKATAGSTWVLRH